MATIGILLPVSTERQQLEATIAGLEAQRPLLGDAIVDAALAPLRARLASLAAAPTDEPPAQTLRQVTILFLDIVGSTALSQHLDPEETHVVMDRALARFTGVVESHGGKVLNYAGDSVLAVFGADEAREDDPERAVRAGLALLDAGRKQGELVKRQHGHDGLNVRVGVHVGSVLLGGGVDAEHSIHGSTVNIAARMEQSAPAGGLRISHDTYRHVRGVFDVEPQPPIQVKGVDQPVLTYLVQRAKPRAFRVATRGIEGVETRMVGRDAELAKLQDAFHRLCSGGRLAAVTVVAEAGMGKSRLLYEFQNWAEAGPDRFTIFQGRADPQTQSQPYGLLRHILAWRLQIADSDSMDSAKDKIEQGIAPLFEADDGSDMAQAHAHLLGHLIGLDFTESKHLRGILDDGKQIRDRGFHAAAQMLRRVAAQDGMPVVLLLDDLHWADDGSLDFLNYLVQVNRDVPMLVLGLTRPTLLERRADWSRTGDINQRIDLAPLDKGVSRLLVDELLKKLDEIPSTLRELITGGAEGNPFYMEELVKMLVDEGAIKTGTGHWAVIPDKLVATHVPQTLTGVLQARLDGLKPAEKLALQQASVIGVVFWDQALSAIDSRAIDALPALARRELIVPRQDASFEGLREYAFKHQILHQVTYDTLLKRIRREAHAKVAAWLAGLTDVRANDFLGVTAEHFEEAGDCTKACEFFTRAAEHATARYAHEAAVGYVANALALIDGDASPDTLLRWRLLDVRERTLDLQGKRAEQQADIDALQQLADALDNDARRGDVAWRRSDIALRTADFRAMESAARQAMALAERAGDGVLRLRAQQRLAIALSMLDDVAASEALTLEGLAAARAQGLRDVEARFLNMQARNAITRDNIVVSLTTDQQVLRICRGLGDRLFEATTLVNLGYSWLMLGDYTQARRHLEEGLQLTRATGNHATEPYALVSLSILARWQGDDSQALAHAQSALDIAIAVKDSAIEAAALVWLGDAELALGRHAAAATAFQRAHALDVALGDPGYRGAAGSARVALAEGDAAGAMLRLEGLLAHLAAGGPLDGADQPQLIRLTCHQVLTRAADPRAAEVLGSAYAKLQARAATIADATLRHSFLTNVPENREIVALWAAQQVAAANEH